MGEFGNAIGMSAAQSGLSLAGGIVSTAVGAAINNAYWKKQYQQQRADALADREHLESRQDELIRQQQAPAQVERLKEAGLNPALAYGGNSASPAPVVNNTVPNPSPGSSFSSLPVDMLGFLKQAQDNRLRERETVVAERQQDMNEDLASFDITLKRAQSIEALAHAGLMNAEEAGKIIDNLFAQQSFQDRLSSIKANLDKTYQEVSNLGLQGTLLQSEINMIPLKIENIQAEIENVRENSKLSRSKQEEIIQGIVESQSRTLYIDAQKAYTDSKKQIEEALSKHEISMAEYKDKMKKVDFVMDQVTDAIGSVVNIGAVVGGAGLLKGVFSGKGKSNSVGYEYSKSSSYGR